MLVLTRTLNQVLEIGTGITVTVVEIKGKQVRIGIDAPKDVPINRKEAVLKEKKK